MDGVRKMTANIYSNETLAELRSVEKLALGRPSRWLRKPRVVPVHRQRSHRVRAISEGGKEYRFEIYERQSLREVDDFSCGIAYVSLDGSRLTLARYNGPSHQHGDIVFKPHIHLANERTILSGRKPEREAKETARFKTLGGALACLAEDFNVQGINAQHDEERLF